MKIEKSKYLSPKLARTIEQVCLLNRDNTNAGDFWMMTDGETVTLCHQKLGEPAIGSVTIPRELFIRFVNWYQRPQKISRDALLAAANEQGNTP